MASLRLELKRFEKLVDSLLVDLKDAKVLEAKYQRLIAESALLRLFYTFDTVVEVVALKLLTNTLYCDGTSPTRVFPPFRSVKIASNRIDRLRPKGSGRFTKWTMLKNVQQNLAAFVPITEHFLVQRRVMDPVFEDMRHLRNHIAHGSNSTQREFSVVVAKIYPTKPKGISPGKLLVSPRRAFVGATSSNRPRVIEQYLLWSKVAIKLLVKG